MGDNRKFKELVLYVARKGEEDSSFGATKLNKILFFSDFLAYGQLGRSITGEDYQKLEWGPAPVRLLPLQNEMIEAGDCALQKVDRFGHTQKRLVPLREAKLDLFSGAEIAIVDRVISSFQGRSAIDVSDLSHQFLGWEIADFREVIPYPSVFLSRRELSAGERQHAKDLKPSGVRTAPHDRPQP